MKPLRPFGLFLALAAWLALSCQTVTRLVTSPTPPPVPGGPTLAAPRPSGHATATPPAASVPTFPPSDAAVPLLGTPAESQKALSDPSASFLEALAKEQYSGNDFNQMNRTFPFTIPLAQEQTLLWRDGWCATTQAILSDNLQHIAVAFEMDGAPVDLSQFYAYDSQRADQLACHSYVAAVYNWPKGKTVLQSTVTFAAAINDGLNDYPAGNQVFVYTITRR